MFANKLPAYIFIFYFLAPVLLEAQTPVSNPYTDKYGDNEQHWTHQIPWEQTVSIKDFPGADWDEKLERAQDYLDSLGGGVVYFPAGDYHFQNDITLGNGIVLRGETPVHNEGTNEHFAPPSRLLFPAYIPTFEGEGTAISSSFRRIRSEFTYYGIRTFVPEDTVRNIGLVNLDINRANLIMHPSYVLLASSSGGTQFVPCYLTNVIVMGVRNNNAAFPLPGIPSERQEGWQRWPLRYIANLDALAQENLVICNNRFNDNLNNTIHPIPEDSFDQPGYLVYNQKKDKNDTITEGYQARFHYNNHYGIVANRFYNSYTIENGEITSGSLTVVSDMAAEPGHKDNSPLFNRGLEIRNNYVHNTQQVAMFVAGQGMQITDNVISDTEGKQQWVSRSGYYPIAYDAFLENRGIDFSGSDIVIENNWVEVHRTRFASSGYYSNDGEGIMAQECCGGSKPVNLSIKHNTLIGSNAYIGLYKTQDIRNVQIDSNDMNGNNIYVNANTNNNDYLCYKVQINHNTGTGSITLRGDQYGEQCTILNNTGSGNINTNCYVHIANNTGLQYDTCITSRSHLDEPDSLCYEYEESTFCFENTEKKTLACLDSHGLPSVSFEQAHDILAEAGEGTVWLSLRQESDQLDSVQILQNGRHVQTLLDISLPIEIKLGQENLTYIHAKAYGCSYTHTMYTYSPAVQIYREANPDQETKIHIRSEEASIVVYPNPTNRYLRIQGMKVAHYTILDQQGRIQQRGKGNTVILGEVAQGLYHIVLENDNMKKRRISFVVEQ